MSLSDEVLVPEEICAYLRIKKAKFYSLASGGRLSFLFKVGNEWRARRTDLEDWIRNNTTVMLSLAERSAPVSKDVKEPEVESHIDIDQVQALLTEEGYEVTAPQESLLAVRDLESGIVIHAVLQENVLFCTVSCLVVKPDAVTPDLMRKMLAADNGISTSAFQLYARQDGSVAITLNNFCKLQAMGEDDKDDILSCLEFLVIDVCSARDLLSELVL